MEEGVPQPGSVLSLISNNNVKYVGTLFHIDMDSAQPSLRLKNVRCYGTEGRGEPHEARPPSDEILPDVVFRGTDIIFLEVQSYYHAPPEPQPQPKVSYGPQGNQGPPHLAPQILSSAPQYEPERPMWGSLGNEYSAPGPAYGGPVQVSQVHAPQAVAAAPMVLVTPSAPPRPAAAPARPAQPAQRSQPNRGTGKAATPFETVQANSQQGPTSAAGPSYSMVPPGMAIPQPPVMAAQMATQPITVITPAPGLGAPGLGQPAAAVPLVVQATPLAAPQLEVVAPGLGIAPPPGHGPPHHQGRGRGRGRGRGFGRGRGGGRAGPPPPHAPPVPQEDFNFEEGFQKFDKDDIKAEASTPNGVDPSHSGNLYKKDEFFDVLSSDLTEKLQMGEQPSRPKFSEQRQLDMETFGGSGLARRGRGRGPRRGRGSGLNPYATGREHLEPPQERGPHLDRGRHPPRGRGGRGRGRGRHSDAGRAVVAVQ